MAGNLYQKILDSINIVDVISKYIKLSKKGINYVGLCPFHGDTKPSLFVNPKKNIWKCFVCGAKGNAISFVQQFNKVSYWDAAIQIANEFKIDISEFSGKLNNTIYDKKIKYLYDINNQANIFFTNFITQDLKIKNYLLKRKINNEIIEYFKLGYCPFENEISHKVCDMLTNKNNIWDKDYPKENIWNEQQLVDASLITLAETKSYDFFSGRLIFPIFDRNNYIVGFSGRSIEDKDPKYLNSRETKIFNKYNTFYNLNNAIQNIDDKVIIVEGYMDTIAYYQAGYKNVIALMGVAINDEHIKLLQSIDNIKTIILSFDNDNAGINANIAVGKKLLESAFNVFVVKYTNPKLKDVDEIFQNDGKIGVDKIVNNRVDFISFLINNTFKPSQMLDEKMNILNDILPFIVENGDRLLKTKHIEEISLLTQLKLIDLQDKYEEIYKQMIGASNITSLSTRKILTEIKGTSDFDNYDAAPFNPIQEENTTNNINETQDEDILNFIEMAKNKIIDIIRFCVVENDYIDTLFKNVSIINSINDYLPLVVQNIIKAIFIIHSKGILVNLESIKQLIGEYWSNNKTDFEIALDEIFDKNILTFNSLEINNKFKKTIDDIELLFNRIKLKQCSNDFLKAQIARKEKEINWLMNQMSNYKNNIKRIQNKTKNKYI